MSSGVLLLKHIFRRDLFRIKISGPNRPLSALSLRCLIQGSNAIVRISAVLYLLVVPSLLELKPVLIGKGLYRSKSYLKQADFSSE